MTNKMPIAFTKADLLAATGGSAICGLTDKPFGPVQTDSRLCRKNDIFIAIRGENHDAHRFIPDVLKAPVGAVVFDTQVDPEIRNEILTSGATGIEVADTTTALGDMAAFQRKRSGAELIAVTGSNGKTSTRRMIASIIEGGDTLLTTSGNLNNQFGLPMTLLGLSPSHTRAVVELGTSGPGEIDYLGKIAAPQIGVITNVSAAHLEGLKTVEGVRDAKAELLTHIPKDGTAVLDGDDPLTSGLSPKCKILHFGESETCDVTGKLIEASHERIVFDLVIKNQTTRVTMNTPGVFMMKNAFAAAAAATSAGFDIHQIAAGLERFTPEKGRLTPTKTPAGLMVIDDTYNANPASMAAGIKTLASIAKERGILVCGDMLELGENSHQLHEEAGRLAATSGIMTVLASGTFAEDVARGAISGGMKPENIITGTKAELVETLKTSGKAGDWVLIKGSRSMHMETIINDLCQAAHP